MVEQSNGRPVWTQRSTCRELRGRLWCSSKHKLKPRRSFLKVRSAPEPSMGRFKFVSHTPIGPKRKNCQHRSKEHLSGTRFKLIGLSHILSFSLILIGHLHLQLNFFSQNLSLLKSSALANHKAFEHEPTGQRSEGPQKDIGVVNLKAGTWLVG